MDCGKIRVDLHAYLEDVVTADERVKIEGHLASCQDCRMALEDLKQTMQLLKNLDEVEPPAWLTQRVLAQVRAESAAKKGLFTRLFGWVPMNLPATAVATLVIAVTAVVLIKSMEPKLQETVQPTVIEQPPAPAQEGTERQAEPEKRAKSRIEGGENDAGDKALGPQSLLQKPLPAPQAMHDDRPAPAIATTPAPAENILPEKTPGTAMKKTETAGAGISEDRMAASRENKTLSPQQEPDALRAAPSAPAVSSAPKPAAALPEQGIARGRAALKDTPQAEQARPSAKAAKEKTAGPLQQHQQLVTERYASGKPRVVITYQNASGKSEKVMEERFDEQGRRHGLHRSYGSSGSLTAEVLYEHGNPVSIREFNADGTLRTGISDRDWPWLKPDLR